MELRKVRMYNYSGIVFSNSAGVCQSTAPLRTGETLLHCLLPVLQLGPHCTSARILKRTRYTHTSHSHFSNYRSSTAWTKAQVLHQVDTYELQTHVLCTATA